MNFLNQLLDQSRLFKVLYDILPDIMKRSNLYDQVADYIEEYAKCNNITAEDAITIYSNYSNTYNKNCKDFIKSGKYPAGAHNTSFLISRENYDMVLLLSVLFTQHRFRIMKLLSETPSSNKGLFIGVGPGLEISLTLEKYKKICAYDLSANKFLFSKFPTINMHIDLYRGQNSDYFDSIFMIELLEHLQDPLALLDIAGKSVKKGGRVYLTTATNIPQFDHLYNFPMNHIAFEEQLKRLGFEILFKEIIPHNYLTVDLNACNHFYTIEKK